MSTRCAAMALLGLSALAQVPGPGIGGVMPHFELRDQHGNPRTLRSLQGPRGALLLFHRSTSWCAYCKAQLLELEQNREDFTRLGIGIAAISYDSVASLSDFAGRSGIRYPLLSDAGSALIRKIGILNDTVPEDNPYFGSPYPCMFILDPRGTILAKYFEDDYRRRNIFTDILVRRFGAVPEARKKDLDGKHLEAVATASASIASPGRTVSLAIDVTLPPGMHVYAPGVQGYLPLTWTIADSPAVTSFDVSYPAGEELRLPVIGETVLVYRGRIRIKSAVVISDDPGRLNSAPDSSGRIPIAGTLRYQACDDRVCYPPESLAIRWDLQLLGFTPRNPPAPIP